MPFKFEKLEVWQVALDYSDLIYEIAGQLPKSEEANLKSQIVRAATTVALNIAESTTSQTDVEKARFLGLAIRSVLETVACQHIISRRGFLQDSTPLRQAYKDAMNLAGMLQAMRDALTPKQAWIREETVDYGGVSVFDEEEEV
ncbi:MAG TPA: four helix bundle protein [Chloroflexia bacterium]|nr:four helix bundle protein [Chloroflexia bacterium]